MDLFRLVRVVIFIRRKASYFKRTQEEKILAVQNAEYCTSKYPFAREMWLLPLSDSSCSMTHQYIFFPWERMVLYMCSCVHRRYFHSLHVVPCHSHEFPPHTHQHLSHRWGKITKLNHYKNDQKESTVYRKPIVFCCP